MGNNIKIARKNAKRVQENKTRNTTRSQNDCNPKRPTKRTERIKNCSKRGSSTTEMLSQQNSAKIEISKMSQKKTKQSNNITENRKQRTYKYIHSSRVKRASKEGKPPSCTAQTIYCISQRSKQDKIATSLISR